MKLLPILSAAAAAALLTACASSPIYAPPPPPPPRPPAPPPPPSAPAMFRTSDFNWSTTPGPGRINGHLAFARGMFTCTGAGVVLMPETPWVRARMQTLYGATSGAALPAAEVRARTPKAPDGLNAYIRQTTCDAANKFSFAGLQPGAWYVITVARPANGKGAEMAIMRRVDVPARPVPLEL